jgi:hypothetical protein
MPRLVWKASLWIVLAAGGPSLLFSPAPPTHWVPRSFAFFAKGRVPRTLTPARQRRVIAKRNLSPSLIHPHS